MSKYVIKVGEGSCGMAAGAGKVYAALERELNEKQCGEAARLTITGCIGMCYLEPIVDVYVNSGKDNSGRTHKMYCRTDAKFAALLAEAIANDSIDNDALSKDEPPEEDKQFLEKQTRIALRHCGRINP